MDTWLIVVLAIIGGGAVGAAAVYILFGIAVGRAFRR